MVGTVDLPFGVELDLIPDTKNSDPLKIPLSVTLRTPLESIQKHPESDYVLHQPDVKRYQGISFDFFRGALLKAGLDQDIHFRDLRHTAASHLVMSEVDLATVKEILGHKDISMTLHYSHLTSNHKRKAMENLGAIFFMDTKEVEA